MNPIKTKERIEDNKSFELYTSESHKIQRRNHSMNQYYNKTKDNNNINKSKLYPNEEEGEELKDDYLYFANKINVQSAKRNINNSYGIYLRSNVRKKLAQLGQQSFAQKYAVKNKKSIARSNAQHSFTASISLKNK